MAKKYFKELTTIKEVKENVLDILELNFRESDKYGERITISSGWTPSSNNCLTLMHIFDIISG